VKFQHRLLLTAVTRYEYRAEMISTKISEGQLQYIWKKQ